MKGEGAIVCEIEDDDGIVHPIKIKKALYVPEATSFLIASQQWAKQANDNYPKPENTWCSTKSRHCILYWKQEWYHQTYWKQERCHRTILVDPSTNVAKTCSAPPSNTYRMFVAAYEQEHKIEDMEYVLYSNVESDYEDDDEYPKQRHNPRGHKPLLNLPRAMDTFITSPRGRIMCLSLRHQELEF